MERDVLLIFVAGAGLLTLGTLARLLPGGGLVLATGAGLGGTCVSSERVFAELDVHGTPASPSSAHRGAGWSPCGATQYRVDAARGGPQRRGVGRRLPLRCDACGRSTAGWVIGPVGDPA